MNAKKNEPCCNAEAAYRALLGKFNTLTAKEGVYYDEVTKGLARVVSDVLEVNTDVFREQGEKAANERFKTLARMFASHIAHAARNEGICAHCASQAIADGIGDAWGADVEINVTPSDGQAVVAESPVVH
jgi:hypothetical protein